VPQVGEDTGSGTWATPKRQLPWPGGGCGILSKPTCSSVRKDNGDSAGGNGQGMLAAIK
jgi:hypothetical protein